MWQYSDKDRLSEVYLEIVCEDDDAKICKPEAQTDLDLPNCIESLEQIARARVLL